jgi:Fe-S cluster biogenesis protein NfuA
MLYEFLGGYIVCVIFRSSGAMGTIERDLMECCSGCDSSKITERKVIMFIEQVLSAERNK